jgi:3-phenylpropionate/trans-cinnamate dioxygenase ferredoxin subunit
VSAELPVEAAIEATAATRRLDVGAAADVAPGTMLMTWVDGTEPVLVVNVDGAFHAVQGICSHEYFELDKGFLTDGSLTCALHLSRFDLDSGDALDPPADEPLAVYPVTVADGRLIIEFPG